MTLKSVIINVAFPSATMAIPSAIKKGQIVPQWLQHLPQQQHLSGYKCGHNI